MCLTICLFSLWTPQFWSQKLANPYLDCISIWVDSWNLFLQVLLLFINVWFLIVMGKTQDLVILYSEKSQDYVLTYILNLTLRTTSLFILMHSGIAFFLCVCHSDSPVNFLGCLYSKFVLKIYRGKQIILWFPDRKSVCTHSWHQNVVVFMVPLNLT